MIVGNGEIAAGASDMIDAADLVVRFNECGSFGSGGRRTDVVAVCNTGRPAKSMITSLEWRNKEAVRAATEIWSVRDPRKFAALRAPLALSHPELDDFCDDYTDGFSAFAMETGKRHVVIDAAVHKSVDEALKIHDPEPYVVPSSGMIVIAEILASHPDDHIVIAGFGHVGWDGHPFAAERRLVESYISAGRLRRFSPGDFSFSSSSQGA
ncbi:Urease operon accessory protein [Rhizobium tubonense]|uniref:Urease operon accessory protein n=2 Tax=Rhizobium tubonense TaxID=484088 RepID=A0A2W4CP58_9HYPH|nr:glycosyltransferase family 29 protein [Rhizobium tubonense]PZM14161.1 Urease operon accessory protein [Rhizobium tubonense]